jgi:sodium-independent organic anion transporter
MTEGYDNQAYGADPEDKTDKKPIQNGAKTQYEPEDKDKVISKTDLPPKHINHEDIPYDLRCGYMSCRPNRLQCCNNPKAILCWLSFFAITQGFVINGINNVNTTSIERRFSLTSTQVGWISSIYDISAGFLVLPITYYGTHGHQPRMLSFMAIVMAVGSFIMSLPHFITDDYNLGGDVAEKCDLLSNTTLCEKESSNLSNYLYVLMLGMFLHGIGGTTLYTLGVVYLDSNVKSKNSPLYQGIMLTFSTMGPAVGYVVGGILLDFYVDIDTVGGENLPITSDDARWVGAWWIGFLCSGTLFIIVAIGMFPFPKETPAGLRNTSQRVSEAHQNGAEEECSKEGFMSTWRDVPKAFTLLVKNPVLVFTTLATTIEGCIIAGFATFLPKIIQNQFKVSVSWAALLAGSYFFLLKIC